MSEVYHTGSCVPFVMGETRGIITLGPDPLKIVIGKRTYHFEWHRYFGPSLLKKNGDVAKRQPGEHHPWWDAVHAWYHQGRRVQNGVAIWDSRQMRLSPSEES